MCLAIIPLLILKYKSKKLLKSKGYIEKVKKLRIRKYIFIIIAGLIDNIQTMIFIVFLYGKKYNFWIIDIIIISLLSYFILKTRLHRHHYLSIIMILIANILLIYINLIDNDLSYIHILTDFLFEVFVCFIHVINKYNMEYQFCSPYEISFYNGIVSIILYIISSLLFSIYDNNYLDQYILYFKNFDFNEFYLSFLYIILNFIYNISILLTNKYYNPFYILILLIIVEIISHFIYEYYVFLKILLFIHDFILIFTILVFNEIIELNCFGLSKKTKKNMEKTANLELLIDENKYNETRRSNASDVSENQINIDNYKVELGKIPLNSEE